VAGFVATRWEELVKLGRLLFPHRVMLHCERCGREEKGFSWTVLWRILRHECRDRRTLVGHYPIQPGAIRGLQHQSSRRDQPHQRGGSAWPPHHQQELGASVAEVGQRGGMQVRTIHRDHQRGRESALGGVPVPEGERAEQFLWKGDRLANKELSADAALDLMLQTVKSA